MKGLTDNTSNVLTVIAQSDFLTEYTFIGGSALAVQIEHRLSEDLDFCKWKSSVDNKPSVNWPEIEKYITPFGIKDRNILDFNQVDFFLKNGVKISFYANNLYTSPVKEKVNIAGNVYAPDIETIGAMKLELMLRRASFRDYYDIYSILREGKSIKNMVYEAGKYSGHTLKSKNILAFITNGENYRKEEGFVKLNPKYLVNEIDIEHFIKTCVKNEF